jgi:hypothetical protein
VSNNKLQKKIPESLKEKSQYALAFGVIGMMLLVAGFAPFVVFFFGIFAYLVWRTFSKPSTGGTREVFEFYLAANEMLRDDDRRWFGFEMQETIARGEHILQAMNGAPPLVYFTLGALYNKAGDDKSAVNHLAYVIENENSAEPTYNYPSPQLRNYVRVLRKIERDPAEAPQTSAAVRALERARRIRGKILLEQSREALKVLDSRNAEKAEEQARQALSEAPQTPEKAGRNSWDAVDEPAANGDQSSPAGYNSSNGTAGHSHGASASDTEKSAYFNGRQPISELLRDIYDEH